LTHSQSVKESMLLSFSRWEKHHRFRLFGEAVANAGDRANQTWPFGGGFDFVAQLGYVYVQAMRAGLCPGSQI
jgi:hypothetical protein